ncbi:MAG: carbohydrate deacetylase [Desulfovibrionaceae bacterium]
MLVVINADDLGLHKAVTRAVEDLAGRGRLASASLLVNGPCARDALKLAGLGLGVHLNLLRGRPLGSFAETASFTGPDGVMLGSYAALFSRYARRALDLDQATLEFSRQIEAALDMGLAPTHLDSEKHIHAWPRLWAVARELARRYHIPWLRRPVERVPAGRLDAGAWRARLLNAFCRAGPRHDGPPASADAVCGVADQGRRLAPRSLLCAARPEDFVLEVCCHPGAPEPGDPPLDPAFGPLRVDSLWRDDYESLFGLDWPAALQELGARATHFGRIDPATRRSL